MKKIILCLFCSLFTTELLSQPSLSLSKTIGGSGMEHISDLIADNDGHLIALGVADSVDRDTSCHYHGGTSDIWLVKMDEAGNIIWQKCYGGNDEDNAYQIIQTVDSGFLFVGTTWSNNGDVTFNHGGTDLWLVKVDSDGNIQWQKSIGSSAGERPYDLIQLKNGNYILACWTTGNNGDFPLHYGGGFSVDAWVVFISPGGVIDTALRYGGSDDDYITDVIELSNGDLQLFGYSRSTDYDLTGITAFGNMDGWILRTDSNGLIKWQKRWGGESSDGIDGAVILEDKGFLTAGTTFSMTGEFAGNHGQTDIWILRLDSDGNKISNFLYGGSESDAIDWQMRLIPSGSDLFTLGTWTNSDDGNVGFNYGFNDFWFLTINSSGSLVNSKVCGGSLDDEIYSNNILRNNTAIAGGLTYSNDFDVQNYHGNGDGWLIKLEGYNLVGTINKNENRVSIYPNPMHEKFTINIKSENTSPDAILEIFSVAGKLLISKKISTKDEVINLKNLPAGTYEYLLLDNVKNKIGSGKLIVQ